MKWPTPSTGHTICGLAPCNTSGSFCLCPLANGGIIEEKMPSVLILDDDHDVRLLMRNVFELLGASQSVTAASVRDMASTADAVLATKLAILDVNLGAGQPSGIDAFRWLQERNYPGKVVFLTGHARSHPLVAEAAVMGADVLEKPVDLDVLNRLFQEAS
jgi:DNA-binding NtrC family response regulator